MTNTTILGTTRDNSASYAAGSHELWVEFSMFGLRFKAHHFVRTDSYKVNALNLYIRHESSWCDDYVKTVDLSKPVTDADPVIERALHLLTVAAAEIPADTAERFAAMELS